MYYTNTECKEGGGYTGFGSIGMVCSTIYGCIGAWGLQSKDRDHYDPIEILYF